MSDFRSRGNFYYSCHKKYTKTVTQKELSEKSNPKLKILIVAVVIVLITVGGLFLLSREVPTEKIQDMPGGQNITDSAEPERFELSNGLIVILLENHKEAKVAVESFYPAGFIYEPKGKAQISHIVEHMTIKSGTQSYNPDESFTLLQGMGMTNAETLASFVHYDYVVPSHGLETVLKIESERLSSINFSEEILGGEIQNAVQEIDFVQNSSKGGLIKFGLIGLVQVMKFGETFVPVYSGTFNITVEDVKEFHNKHYGPNGAFLIIVGDFDSEKTKSMVERYFSGVPQVQREITEVRIDENIQATWDLASDALYLVYPKVVDSVEERIAMTLFGDYLSRRLLIDTNLKNIAKTSFCSNRLYPVGEMPFFVFVEVKKAKPSKRPGQPLMR